MPVVEKTKLSEQLKGRLLWEERDGEILVRPENDEAFLITVEEAIAACRSARDTDQAGNIIKFKIQFDRLLNTLGKWIHERSSKIARAFVTIRDAGLLFLIVHKEQQYDSIIEDELTVLDMAIAQSGEFAMIRLSVLCLPSCDDHSIGSFVGAGSLEYPINAPTHAAA